jgi:hypothetical protein
MSYQRTAGLSDQQLFDQFGTGAGARRTQVGRMAPANWRRAFWVIEARRSPDEFDGVLKLGGSRMLHGLA